MTPRQQVAVIIAVFSALGIGVSVAIIGFGGGFSGAGGNIFNPPKQGDIYVVGSQVKEGMALDYSLDSKGPNSSLAGSHVSIKFNQKGGSWLTTLNVVNGTGNGKEIETMYSRQLTKEGQADEASRPFLEPVESSIFAVRDMDYGGRDKYLVTGAPWNTIFYESTSTIVRVAGQETVQTQAGTFDAFVLSYKLKDNTSKIWVVKDLPLPVKAQVYDQDDQPLYSYELLKLTK